MPKLQQEHAPPKSPNRKTKVEAPPAQNSAAGSLHISDPPSPEKNVGEDVGQSGPTSDSWKNSWIFVGLI